MFRNHKKMKSVKSDLGEQASLMLVHPSHMANPAVEFLFFTIPFSRISQNLVIFVYLSSPLRLHFWKKLYTSEEHDFYVQIFLMVPFGLIVCMFVCKNVYVAQLIVRFLEDVTWITPQRVDDLYGVISFGTAMQIDQVK